MNNCHHDFSQEEQGCSIYCQQQKCLFLFNIHSKTLSCSEYWPYFHCFVRCPASLCWRWSLRRVPIRLCHFCSIQELQSSTWISPIDCLQNSGRLLAENFQQPGICSVVVSVSKSRIWSCLRTDKNVHH